MMIVSRWIFNKFGWGMAALITPTVLLLTGERSGNGNSNSKVAACYRHQCTISVASVSIT